MGIRRQHGAATIVLGIILELFLFRLATSQSFIGVNYGTIADNLPPAASTASLLMSTSIGKLRLYEPQPDLVAALAGSNISILLGIPNGAVPNLASSPAAAASWAAANIPTTVPVSAISVGNELLNSGDPTLAPQLLPAMQNLLAALPAGSTTKGIVSRTVPEQAMLATTVSTDLHRALHGRAVGVGPAVLRRVPPGPRRQPGPGAGLPAPERGALHDQPVPLLRVRLRHAAGDAGVLPVPAQRGARRRRVGAHLHQHVRRAAGRHPRGAGRQGVQRRGDRHRRDRVAVQGRRRRGRRHGGQRQGLQHQPRGAPQVPGRHAADAGQVGGHVHLRALRRGPQGGPGVGAVLRAVQDRPDGELRRRAREEQQHGGTDQFDSGSGTGHAAAEQRDDADGVLRDHGRRARQQAGPAVAAEQLVLHPGRSRVAAS